jgi:carbamoyl-phosphate synthase small subunit
VTAEANGATVPMVGGVRASRTRARYHPVSDAALALADGRVFRGRGFGARVNASGEAVFTTTMVGYQEVCSDPSFRGQIVCMTFPLIGNYGIDPEQDESRRPWIAGLVVREHCVHPSHARSVGTIDNYLSAHGIPGIFGVDTRALTLHIREVGDIRAAIVHDAGDVPDAELVRQARSASLPGEYNVVREVMNVAPERIDGGPGPHIVVVDCGVKRNIVRSLLQRSARVTIVPFGTPFAQIEALAPDGLIVSPGPGDPANLDAGLDVIKRVVARQIPYFGICLGHQLLGRAIGASTRKLKFGHRGGNHPVRDSQTGKVTITSQNHGFELDPETVPIGEGWEIRLMNLNDGSVEGLGHRHLPIMTVQFHPESSPGPLDNNQLFDRFLELVIERSRPVAGAHQ